MAVYVPDKGGMVLKEFDSSGASREIVEDDRSCNIKTDLYSPFQHLDSCPRFQVRLS